MGSIKEVKLGEVLRHRKQFIQIKDTELYKRCRVQLHAKGIALRDMVKGAEIRTKQQQVCKTNDFIVAEMDAKFGGYGVVKNGLEGAIVSSHYFLFEPNPERIEIEYLELLCLTDFIQSQIKATGSTNYAAIRPYHVLEITVPLPDLQTQKSIVARLQSLQSLHREADATLARLQANVKRLRQSILQEAIQGKLVDYQPAPGEKTGAELLADIRAEKERRAREAGKKPEAPLPPVTPEEMPFEVPEGWVWCRLGEVFKFIDYRGRTPIRTQSGIRLITAKNIRMGYLDENPVEFISEKQYNTWMTRGIPVNGDLLFVTEGHTMGFVAEIDLSFKFALAQRTITLQPYFYSYSKFIVYVIMSIFFQEMLNDNSTGSAVRGIQSARLKEFPIPLPPISVQQHIVSTLTFHLSHLDQLTHQLAALQAKTERLWKSELQQAFKFENEA